jgi:GH25 family lysozyme M1 (1,4-beta-N-acetylmuramidase)
MKMNRRYKAIILVLAVLFIIQYPREVLAFEPWTNVDGDWISADGRTPIKGAVKKGITVTKYQNRAGEINWKRVAQDHISFVMVRLGYYDDPDPYFKNNMAGAESVGIETGVCFYGEAIDVEGAEAEARYVLDTVKDYRVSYPIAYDVESEELLERGLTKSQITEQVKAFCKVIEDAGYRAVIFGSNDWLTQHLDMKTLSYDVWYSRYGLANQFENRTLWRCTDSGNVGGIEGNVCLEFVFVDYGTVFSGTGWRSINGKTYYFQNYKMTKNSTLQIEGSTFYFDREGNPRKLR